jgi:hypothetical protein
LILFKRLTLTRRDLVVLFRIEEFIMMFFRNRSGGGSGSSGGHGGSSGGHGSGNSGSGGQRGGGSGSSGGGTGNRGK